MASGYHLITCFQGWISLRTAYCPWSLSTSGSELPQTQLQPSHALGTIQEISSPGRALKGTNVYSVPLPHQTRAK